jgi:hypothetical protein
LFFLGWSGGSDGETQGKAMENEKITLRLTEEQRQQIRRLTGQETSELRLVVMNGPEPLLLAWGLPSRPGRGTPRPQGTTVGS